MSRPTTCRVLAVLLGAVVGAVLLSGSDQPVTAHPYPRWQELAAPPLSARTHALGVHVLHRVLVLGGDRPGAPALRGGAAYDLRTGIWHRVRTPVAITDRDHAVAAAGVVVLRHRRAGAAPSWWRYDVRHGLWSRMRGLPPRLSVPSAFGSEVYAVCGHRVHVYSVQLDRWTSLPADRLRPALVHGSVRASRSGTLVTGFVAGHPRRLLTDRWDGLRWHRSPSTAGRPVAAAPDGSTRVRMGGRIVVVRGDRAWIRLP